MLNKEEIERYCRQLIIPGFGLKGQEKLKSSSVLIVGAGGLGCPVGLYLAAAGIGRIGILDYDKVEISNLQRQVGHAEERQGCSKASSLAKTLRSVNSLILIEEHEVLISSENGLDIIKPYDLIVDATDNVATRYLLSDACVILRKVLVSGAALRFEGQLTTYNFGVEGPCYRCLHPVPPPMETVTPCDIGGVLGPVTGLVGSLQALEVLKIIALNEPNYSQKMLIFNGQTGFIQTANLRPKQPNCVACGIAPSLTATTLVDYPKFCNSSADDKGETINILPPEDRISVNELEDILKSKEEPFALIIDIRERTHSDIFPLPFANTINIPFSELKVRLSEVTTSNNNNGEGGKNNIIFLCRKGNDSQLAVRMLLKESGILSRDVIGGISEYAQKIDSTIPIV